MYKVKLIEGNDTRLDGDFDKEVETTLNNLVSNGYELIDVKFSTGLYTTVDMNFTKYSALIIVKDNRTGGNYD